MARPTRSDGLYAQCVGRGTRLHPGKKDCLVLDFVDLSALSLVSLPSLLGLPRGFDLQGEDAVAAAQAWQRIQLDVPGLELEAGAITLQEIQQRAAHFDPLTLQVDPEVRAISPLGWASLGSRGLALHFEPRAGQVADILVLSRGQRGKRWVVLWEGREKARFSTLEEAVQAVDYEIEQRGAKTWHSALPDAPWRRAPIGRELAAKVQAVRTSRVAGNLGEALRLAVFAEVWSQPPD